ncbi:hypothetical protein BLNAU_4799 [Blattamonas nauphoetae]|uniref:Uncharacterized protein n=1 Tax=Blattamonas nauphoetae TaxID=2049346 RepID=A0ABQ9Y969_9EUKA|nr:hypothetical protein BLNAU_4799 [Blattamonas nauphoetae]
MMLKDLLVLVTESDWALSTILEIEYINPLEQYCEKAKPCDVPNVKIYSDACSFLRKLKVPSASTASSSELVPFAGRLCAALSADVSEITSLFTDPSSARPTFSAQSPGLPKKSLNHTENTIIPIIVEEFSLIGTMLSNSDITFQNILIDSEYVPLLKSTIVICLDLLRQLKCESNCLSSDRTDLLITVLDLSWSGAASIAYHGWNSFHPVIESVFSDIPQLCSLLERSCRHSSPNSHHLRMIVNLTSTFAILIPHMLDENLIQRVINTSKPMVVPTTNGEFHVRFVWTIHNLLLNPPVSPEDNEMVKRIRKMQFERVLKPTNQYLQFILQREEFIANGTQPGPALPKLITSLLIQTLILEHELLEDGEIVETGREEWEVGWLVEKTDEENLEPRLKKIREDDKWMRSDEKGSWKKRVERQREAGHEDAMEGWLMRLDEETQSEIVDYLESVTVEGGMNNSM